jgi:Glycosyltransferase (GlcNAc)
MAVVRRPTKPSNNGPKTLLATIFAVLFVGIVYIALPSEGDDPSTAGLDSNGVLGKLKEEKGKLRMSVARKKEELREALADSLGKQVSKHLPARLREMRDKHEIVGERLQDIKDGTETVQELLYGEGQDAYLYADKPPMQIQEIIDYLENWIHLLHDTMGQYKNANYEQIWQGYHDLTVKTLYPWDREYLHRMPPRRKDGSIFLSVATYRDENCMNTLKWAYEHAANPEKLFVGLVQQNCEHDCKTGVMDGGKIEDTDPDPDCHKIFCEENPQYCSQVRALHIEEPESLGPYAARYFASKMWDGEEWFMQVGKNLAAPLYSCELAIVPVH